MDAIIDTIDTVDEGVIIATRIEDGWYLFISDYDGAKYHVNPSVVEFI